MSIREATNEYVRTRAMQSGVAIYKLDLDRDPEKNENTVEVTVLWQGSLDEEFYMDSLYAVNVADWIAEMCAKEAAEDTTQSPDWQVMVHEYMPEDAGIIVYSTSSDLQHSDGTSAHL